MIELIIMHIVDLMITKGIHRLLVMNIEWLMISMVVMEVNWGL